MRPLIVNPKEAMKEAEYYVSLSKEEKKIYKNLPKEEQLRAYKEYHINKNSNTQVTIEEHDAKIDAMFKHLQDIGATDLFGTKKEVKTLVSLLKENEQVLYATSGLLDGNTYLIVCTNVRLLFLDKGMVYGLKKLESPFSKINSVSYKVGMIFGEILVHHGSDSMLIKNIMKNTVEKMASTIQHQIEEKENNASSHTTIVQNQVSAADELLKYKQLLDAGVITQEEFDKKKSELL